MGILVAGAEKVEEKVGHLRINLRIVTDTLGRVDARIKSRWVTIQEHFEKDDQVTLRITILRGKRVLKQIIESTIHELEKLSRRLETDANLHEYAS